MRCIDDVANPYLFLVFVVALVLTRMCVRA
jgi:hypothetical protein